MLALFPGTFFLTPVAIAFLRITAGVFLVYAGVDIVLARQELSKARFPIIGTPYVWMIALLGIGTVLAGLLLVVGLWTQAAAAVGCITVIKQLVLSGRVSRMPLSRGAYVLLLVVCLVIFVAGPGLFGVDMPGI